MYFLHVVIESVFKRVLSFIWILHLKLESPILKDALCQVWLKFVPWFCGKRFWNFVNACPLFSYFSPWEKGVTSFKQTWIPSIQRCVVQSLTEIGSVVLEKKSKMRTVYRQTYDGRHAIRKTHVSFQLISSWKYRLMIKITLNDNTCFWPDYRSLINGTLIHKTLLALFFWHYRWANYFSLCYFKKSKISLHVQQI